MTSIKTAKKHPARRLTSSKRSTSKKKLLLYERRIFGLKFHHFGGLAFVLAGTVWAVILAVTHPTAPIMASSCGLNAKLVNSCRPLIGGAASYYPGTKGFKSDILNFESRAHRQMDVPHSYHSPTQTSFSEDEKSFINRANTYMYVNWKPDAVWSNATGGNASVNTRIDTMADSIKAAAPHKLFLTIYHEPENDLSKGGSQCSTSVGNKGTATQYKAMWRNVRKRFDAKGVNNVVWVMNYMGYSGWDCAVKDIWPGNDLVDWVTWDPYTNDKGNFTSDIQRFYNVLTKSSDASHNFNSKPWGIAEMGYEGYAQPKAYNYYDDMASAIKVDRFPNLKMYLLFDENGATFGAGSNWDARIGYARNGTADPTEQQHFNAMFTAVSALGTTPPAPSPPPPSAPSSPPANSTPPPADPPPTNNKPEISITAPLANTTVSGTITVSGETNTKAKIDIVTLRIDGKWIATDNKAPYSFQLNTKLLANGGHSVIIRSLDKEGKRVDSSAITLNVKN